MASGDHFYIAFERSGGFAGMIMSVEIKSDTLSVDEAKNLLSLINDSGFFKMTDSLNSGSGVPDGFNYKISIDLNGKLKALEFGESAITPALRPLVDELTKRAKRR
ncbi:MAG: protealysin inhibitor emfourin [Cyclobacteriaceae bacterium]|nr:protealysin inhibitor emfourin [Cyclobacteriaceae bacterium]